MQDDISNGRASGNSLDNAISFDTAWRQLSGTCYFEFLQAQYNFLKSTHYTPAANLIKDNFNLDINNRSDKGVCSDAFRNMIWSMAIQHGAGGENNLNKGVYAIFKRAEAAVQAYVEKKEKTKSDEETLIRALYNARGQLYPSEVSKRYNSEVENCVNMLNQEKKGTPEKNDFHIVEGAYNPYIQEAQIRLTALNSDWSNVEYNFGSYRFDGCIGSTTRAAILKFQQKYDDLADTGVLDIATLNKLRQLTGNTAVKELSNPALQNASDWSVSASKPKYINLPGQRSSGSYNQIISQFSVASNPRYTPRDVTGDGKNETFCNVFAMDVMNAMGAYLPDKLCDGLLNWLKATAVTCNTKTGKAVTGGEGNYQGWREITALEAQTRANNGSPTIAITSDHIACISPNQPGDIEGVVYVSQAGSSRFDHKPITSSWRAEALSKVRYFTHD
jgi:hypothetical protein